MEKKWNLQDVRPTDSHRKRRTSSDTTGVREPARNEDSISVRKESINSQSRKAGGSMMRGGRLWKIGAAALIIIAVVVAVGIVRTGADVTVTPKQQTVTVNSSFTAHVEPEAGELGYELLSLEADGERQVSASGQEEAEEQAEGTITIYNEYSTESQRLITNTRFESPDGLIFRIFDSVEIPGYTKDSSGNIIAGSITARAFADETGDEYNIGPTRFSVPGLKDTDQYDSIYAKSTEPFTGGFEGMKYVIDEDELESAQSALHDEIRTALRDRLDSERPAGFIEYDDAITYSFDSLPSVEAGEGLATIKERGTLHVPIFNDHELAGYIASKTVGDYKGSPVIFKDPQSLSFAYATSTDTATLGSAQSIDFALSGNADIVWDFEDDTLRNDLAGMSRSELPSVLSEYPAILQAEAKIRPFWKRSFPDNPDKISIERRLDGQN